MADDLVFYTNPRSRGAIVRWMLEEVGAPYRTEVLDFGSPMKSPEYRHFNPMGKVPTIVHRGQVVTECAAICAYLADAFPEVGLAPEPGRRGDYYRWLFFTAGPLEQAVSLAALNVRVTPEQSRFLGCGAGLELVLDTLEGALGEPYVAGDRFTAADLYLGAHLGFGLKFGTIPARPAFAEYVARLNERPAAKRAAALDMALEPAV